MEIANSSKSFPKKVIACANPADANTIPKGKKMQNRAICAIQGHPESRHPA
jgi:hypothetical protein